MLREFEMEAAGIPGHGPARVAASKPLAEHLAAFLEDVKGRGRRPNTLANYRKVIGKLCERCGWVTLADVTAQSFASWRVRSGLTPKFLNDQLGSMRTFLTWMQRNRLILADPLKYVGKVQGAGSREYRRALSVDEARALCAVASGTRASIYLLILYTGLRRFELNRIRWRDFDFEAQPVRLVLDAVDTKGGRRAAVFDLRSEVSAMLLGARSKACLSGRLDDFAFRGRVPSVGMLKRDLAAARIPFRDSRGRCVDLHSLRKTFVTWLSVSGVAPRSAMALARHSDLRLTMGVYTDAAQLHLASEMARMPSISLSKNDSQIDSHGDAQRTVATGVDVAHTVADDHFLDSGEAVGSVAVMPRITQPVATGQTCKMVGAVRFELTTSTSRT